MEELINPFIILALYLVFMNIILISPLLSPLFPFSPVFFTFLSCLISFHLLLLQLHAVPPLSGPWWLGGVAPDCILLLLLSGSPTATTVPPSPNQREQRGPQPHLLSRCLWRPGGAVQRSALYWWRWWLWGSLWPGLFVPGFQQQWPHSPAHPPEGRTGGPPWCHPSAPSTQAAQHTTGHKETVGVSTVYFLQLRQTVLNSYEEKELNFTQ